MCLAQAVVSVLVLYLVLATCETESLDKCDLDLTPSTGSSTRLLRKVLSNLFSGSSHGAKMQFYLFKKAFPTCGQEIRLDDDSLQQSDFNVSHPTRIIIHGWLSHGKASFNRDIKDAYLSIGDFNIIVVDWGSTSSQLNYYGVAELVENLGEIIANFTKHLHDTLDVEYDNMYLIGHSLGAQIAGSAGRQIQPEKFNTIFALDPAGPAFREKGLECRIDSSDAKYVESIQTSENFGFLEPVGNATFLPNHGNYQKCWGYGCSHRRARKFFAESINSTKGFWGTLCERKNNKWHCPKKGQQFKMGGEPSQPKTGTFYVKTKASPPYALGKNTKYLYA